MTDTMGKLIFLPLAGRVAYCSRCGDPCKVADTKDPAAKMLRAADKPSGYCVNCAVAEWFYVTGSREICPDPKGLLVPQIQEQFAKIMAASNADAKPPEINWTKVVANWDLPFRIGAKKTVDPVAHPLPPPIRRARRKSK